jgi:SPP1 family predicted phage head-tail adaptor
MRIGELRKQITIQAEAPTADGAGGYALAWTNVATVWAEIKPVSGNKVFVDQHLEGHVTHQIKTRYRSDLTITTDMRIVHNNRVFNIHSITNTDERNQWWVMLVEEGAAV